VIPTGVLRIAALTALALTALPGCRDLPGHPDAGEDVDAPIADARPDPPDGAPDAMPDPPGGIVECPRPLPPAGEGRCDAVPGTGSAVAVRGDVLGDGTTWLDGEVVYDGQRIVCVGCDCGDAPGRAAATVITCPGAAVSPGLINAHDHLSFNNAYPLPSTVAGGPRYTHRHQWRAAVSTPSNAYGTGATSAGMRWNELRHLLSGTTSIAGSTRATGLVRNLDGPPEPRDSALGLGQVDYHTFLLGDSNRVFRPDCTWNYALSEFAASLTRPGFVTHTAEGIDAYAREEFRCQSRSFAGARDFVRGNFSHIHAIALDAADYYDMARDGSPLIWSPRSNLSLYGNTAQPQVMKRVGGIIALGTDWTYSGSATLPREMACAAAFDDAYLGDAFTDEEIWRMATIDAARATHAAHLIGSLAAGKLADLAVFRAEPGQLHRAVIDATTGDLLLVVRGGEVMAGEADVVAALATGCEAATLCGQPRRICAARELGGTTFATLEATVLGGTAPAYPVELCGVPADEPTCLPSRPGEYAAPTPEDPDGDGVIDGDNCPTVFNPIRPMDGGVQADADGDGVGDACDPWPIGDDLDGDGVPNHDDVCPFVADDQADRDGDGIGDACDACPELANASYACPPAVVTIEAIQRGLIAPATEVTIDGAIVTSVARARSGFTMQDPTITSGAYAGISVFTGSDPGVQIGDRVIVAGRVSEYFGMTQLDFAVVLARAPGTPIAPVPLPVATAAEEAYEGTLVTLTGITRIDIPYDCAADHPACADPRLWQLDQTLLAHDAAWQGTTTQWNAAGAALAPGAPVTGVMTYRFERRRIVPRLPGDVGN
jgi:large repetitive protein